MVYGGVIFSFPVQLGEVSDFAQDVMLCEGLDGKETHGLMPEPQQTEGQAQEWSKVRIADSIHLI